MTSPSGKLLPSWGNVSLAVVDLETTGLYPSCGDRVCEVGIVRVEGGEETEAFSSLVNPERPLSPGARTVNTIAEADLQAAPPFASVAETVERLLRNAIFVGHNASFDLRFLRAEFARLGRSLPVREVVDTLALARSAYAFAGNSLGSIARSLGLQPQGLHRAMADARTTWRVLRKFWEDLAAQGFCEIEHLMALAREAVLPALPPGRAPSDEDLQAIPYRIIDALRANGRLRVTAEAKGGRRWTATMVPQRIERRSDYYYLCGEGVPDGAVRLDRIVDMGLLKEVA